MTVAVIVQAAGGAPSVDELGLLALARRLAEDVVAVVFTEPAPELAVELGRHGAGRVLALDHPALADPLPQPRASALANAIPDLKAEAILLAASILSLDVAADLAFRLDSGLNWDLVDLAHHGGRLVGTRLVANDTIAVTVGWRGSPAIALIRPGSCEARAEWAPAPVHTLRPDVDEATLRVRVVERRAAEVPAGGRLEAAEIVVAGGRGLGEAANFALLEELARILGGQVGATRAVVEAGWYPREAQIGQTGVTVSPRLYLACGISGAIHHKVGMHRSETIVAINSDRQAPIFDLSHLAVVGDALAILPALIDVVREDGRA